MKTIVVLVKSDQARTNLVFLIRNGMKLPSDVQLTVLCQPTKQELKSLKEKKEDELFLIVPEDVRCGNVRAADELLSAPIRLVAAYVHTSAIGQLPTKVADSVSLYSTQQLPQDFMGSLTDFVYSDAQRRSEIRSVIPASRTKLAVAG